MLKMTAVEQKATFFRELATMVEAGMTVGEALGTLRERLAPGRLRMAVIEAAHKTRTGSPFSDAMARYTDVFTPVETAMIRAGEQSGHLDRLLEQIATYLEQEYSLRQMVSRETFYPKIVIVFVAAFPLLLPAILRVITGGTGLLGLFLTLLVTFLKLGGIAAVIWGLYLLTKYLIASSPPLARSLDALKLSIPVFGKVVRRLALARFSRALAALYAAGVSLPQAVGMAADLTGNAALREPMKAGVAKLEAGQGVAEVLETVPHMENMVLQMLKTGEATGNIDNMMSRVADHFEEASASSIRRMATLIMPIATVVLGIIVLFMVMNFYTGFYGGMLDYEP